MPHADTRENQQSVAHHILPTAATMAGVCLTVISIIKLTELSHSFSTLIDDFLALVDRAAHRLFTPDVLAGVGGGDGHQRMPVRRRRNVDDVDVAAVDQLAPIFVSFNLGVAVILGVLDAGRQVLLASAHRLPQIWLLLADRSRLTPQVA